ncbi:MAG: transcription elongation factor GreA [Patescibacteria group bacterium]
MSRSYLTKDRLVEIKKELEDLKNKKRVEVAERLRSAKEYGDLSENAEYTQAREEQASVETRIFELEELLQEVSIIEKSEGGLVQIGSTVIVKKGDGEFRYSIVGSYEARPEEGKISDESPLGHAFMNRKAGETVTISTPSGKETYQIVKVE